MILTGTSLRSSKESLALAKGYPSLLYSTAGIHPHDAKTMNEQTIPQLSTLLKEKQVVAVGECGLDFDRDFSPRPIQEQCFRAQLALAQEVQKPLFLHERAAFDRFVGILKDYTHLPKGVVHGFTVSLTGAISDSRRFAFLEEVVRYVPLERMLIETDAPFMLPKNIPAHLLNPRDKRRNEPAFLHYVAQSIAHFKKISVKEVTEATTKNAKELFPLSA